jgi:hypothetical protein
MENGMAIPLEDNTQSKIWLKKKRTVKRPQIRLRTIPMIDGSTILSSGYQLQKRQILFLV